MADNIASYIRKLEKLQDTMPTIMTDLVKHEAQKAIGEIKQKTPVQTGLLRGNIQPEVSFHQEKPKIIGNQYFGVIVSNVEYASHVEYGHRIVNGKGETIGHVNGVFMVRKGIAQYKSKIMRASVKAFLEKKLRGILK